MPELVVYTRYKREKLFIAAFLDMLAQQKIVLHNKYGRRDLYSYVIRLYEKFF